MEYHIIDLSKYDYDTNKNSDGFNDDDLDAIKSMIGMFVEKSERKNDRRKIKVTISHIRD